MFQNSQSIFDDDHKQINKKSFSKLNTTSLRDMMISFFRWSQLRLEPIWSDRKMIIELTKVDSQSVIKSHQPYLVHKMVPLCVFPLTTAPGLLLKHTHIS